MKAVPIDLRFFDVRRIAERGNKVPARACYAVLFIEIRPESCRMQNVEFFEHRVTEQRLQRPADPLGSVPISPSQLPESSYKSE